MPLQPKYYEIMRADEHDFIATRYKVLSKQYIKIINIFSIALGFGMLCILYGRKANALTYNYELPLKDIIAIILSTIFVVAFLGLGIYYIMVYNYYLDFKKKQKTIEPIAVEYKQHLQVKGVLKYYVGLLHAKHKLVEVTHADYQIINIGDEINIEYASHTNEFFSYF